MEIINAPAQFEKNKVVSAKNTWRYLLAHIRVTGAPSKTGWGHNNIRHLQGAPQSDCEKKQQQSVH